MESIRAISERFANTAYGFFLEKRMAYPIVANYVRNKDVGNIPIWVKLHGVHVTAFSEDGLSVIATKHSTPLMLDSYTSDMCLQSWGRSSYAREMIELWADVELVDTIVVAMPKLTGEEFYTCTVCVEYEWKPLRCACCKVFGHIKEECPTNLGLGVAKNLKKPSHAPRGVPVGPKVGFKPAKEYRPVSKKPTANLSGNKKKCVEPTKEVNNLNLFDVFNSVENDGELGTNGGISNLASNVANSSGSSFWNVETSSTSTTPIVDKIRKLEKLIINGKVTLVDDDGKPLTKVDYPGDHDSEDEVESVDDDMARSMASERVYLLRSKSDTFAKFVEFCSLVKTQLDKEMKAFQCDHGDGSLSMYKARLIANGNSQQLGFDYDKIFSPVVKSDTIRTVLSLATSRHCLVHQLDVKNVFLHGTLSETVYMHQPSGFRDPHRPNHGCLLQWSLNGFEQAPYAWIIASLHQEFSMTDLGPLNYFLGIFVTRTTKGMFLYQKEYAAEVLEHVGVPNCHSWRTPVDTESKLGVDGTSVSDPTFYMSLAGDLQYLTFTRPDLSYVVQQVCLYTHDPREPHLAALKRILRYVRGTLDYGLQQYTLSRSNAEAEYRGVANVLAETSWLRNLLRELHSPLHMATIVYCDIVSAVYLSSNPVHH
ncbi:ribonuclease H-like domain-containing protein [Tanacetum coccineum]